MALAPNLKQKRGIFGSQPMEAPLQTIAGGGGVFGGGQPPVAAAAPEQPKKGFDWGKLIGVLGDSLSIAGGGQASFVPNMIDQRNRQQAQQYAEQTYQRRRADDNTDWQQRQEWERANPKPTNNDTVADFEYIKSILGEESAKKMLMNKVDPPQYRQGPDGQFYRINTTPGGAAPTFTEDDWNKGTPVTGGPSARPAGGF